jgi:hypothetical protein
MWIASHFTTHYLRFPVSKGPVTYHYEAVNIIDFQVSSATTCISSTCSSVEKYIISGISGEQPRGEQGGARGRAVNLANIQQDIMADSHQGLIQGGRGAGKASPPNG